MTVSRYAELAAASNFSFLRGASHPEELVARALALGLSGLGIADRNSVAGVVRAHAFLRENKEQAGDFRLVCGARLVFEDGTPDLLAYPRDRAAWGRLCRLLTRGNLRAEKGDCRLRLADALDFAEGQQFILLDACGREQSGASASCAPESFLPRLRAAAGGRVWIGARRAYGPTMDADLSARAALAGAHGLPLIALNDVVMHDPGRRRLADVLACAREGARIESAGFLLEPNAERHLKPPQEMARLFAQAPRALEETLRFLEGIAFSLEDLRYEYPDELREGFDSEQEALAAFAFEGAARRYPEGVPDKVRASLDHELALVAELGYAAYFLTVHDIVRFARARNILCQGRGSAANSCVCFCLGITEVDPTRHDLLFERFISAERHEPPDIDVDFEHERREEVMQYIYERYGRDRAGLAATVICYRTRSSLRDVGKVFGFSDDSIAALTGGLWGSSSEPTRKEDARAAGLDARDSRLSQALELADELAGFPRHLSQHVGGFVVTRGRLDEVVPIAPAAMEGRTTVEWDKDDLDALGILKIDVLALGMLSALRRGFALLARHYGQPLTLASIPAEEPCVYDMIQRADTIGVFQIESRAQMSMLPRLKPKDFYDLVIEVAIVRPGPIQGDMVHPYLRRRQKLEPVDYPSQELESVLGKTLGVPLFQEQAMRIAIVAAGFTPSEADRLRRAMATFKRAGTIHLFRTKMIEGMAARGYARDFAERCFQQIEGFGTYGFPESHAASFALLVYASAWMKCRYPDVFACALLNAQPMGFYAPAQIVRDAREHGVAVREVDVNFSEWDCALEHVPEKLNDFSDKDMRENQEHVPEKLNDFSDKDMRENQEHVPEKLNDFSDKDMRSIKDLWSDGGSNTSRRAPEPILPHAAEEAATLHPRHVSMRDVIRTACALRLGFRLILGARREDMERLVARRGRGYDSVRDLWLRGGLSISALEALAEADAFRSLGLDRRAALWAVRGLNRAGDKDDLPLFRAFDPREGEPDARLPPMAPGEHVVEDYRHLSLSLKAHPMSFLRPRLAARGTLEAAALARMATGASPLRETKARGTVAGLVLVRQRPGSARGVVFLTIEDETGVANVIVWPKVFEKYRAVVIGARCLSVCGPIQNESGVVHVVAEKCEDLSAMLTLLSEAGPEVSGLARADEARRPQSRDKAQPRETPLFAALAGEAVAGETAAAARLVMPKGRNFR